MFMLFVTATNSYSPSGDELDVLISRIAEGDSNALAGLYESTKAGLFGYALSALKSEQDAEDVLHDCYLSVWSNAKNYVSGGKPMAWLITIVKNLCTDKLRKQKTTEELDESHNQIASCFSEVELSEDKWIIEQYLKRLTDEERQIVVLHVVSGFKFREIASLLKISLSTVLSKYRRGLIKIKNILEEEKHNNDK